MILTTIVQTAADVAIRQSYSPPAAGKLLLGPIANLIKSHEARTLPPFHGARIVCRLPGGQIYYESQLAVDTDGSRFAHQDATGQGRTAWQPGGRPIDADSIPYFSVMIPIYRDHRFHLRKGDYAAVIYKDVLAFAVLADVGGAHLGEGSLELHRQLGHERVVHAHTARERFIDDGIGAGVITIAFPHSGNPHVAPDAASIQTAGQSLWRSLLVSTSGDFVGGPMASRSA